MPVEKKKDETPAAAPATPVSKPAEKPAEKMKKDETPATAPATPAKSTSDFMKSRQAMLAGLANPGTAAQIAKKEAIPAEASPLSPASPSKESTRLQVPKKVEQTPDKRAPSSGENWRAARDNLEKVAQQINQNT
ncbi:MAG: hypothetical protein LLG04_05985 [Parachlamydia sp.]|nr:hypothetical protein [Parachlamydia sp.]